MRLMEMLEAIDYGDLNGRRKMEFAKGEWAAMTELGLIKEKLVEFHDGAYWRASLTADGRELLNGRASDHDRHACQ